MKFTNGYWLPAAGVTLHSPFSVYDYEFNERDLRLFLPVKKVENRGDTLNGMLLTVTLSAPEKGVIAVRAEHFTGKYRKRAKFDLSFNSDHQPEFSSDDEKLYFKSGDLKAEIPLVKRYEINFFYKDRYLTRSRGKSLAYIKLESDYHMKDELSLSVGELIYGLGERFTSFVKNGQSVDIKNCDGGTTSEQAYKNVPFYISNRNYGIFVNHTEVISFEVASEKVNCVQFSVEGESLEYYVIGGDSPKDVLRNYSSLSGRPPLVPAWSFGLWLSTSFLTSYDEKIVMKFIDGMNSCDIPIDVFHFDCFWMREYYWCDFTWDSRVFPDPQGMLKRIKAKGIKICLWINPYIAQRSPLFIEGKENGYLLRKENGDIWQTDMWQAGMGIVDFTNPEAALWYSDKLQKLIDMGVDCFKTDFGERIPEKKVKWHSGVHPSSMRNYYSYIYNKTVYDLLYKNNPKMAILFARSATAGGQKFPIHWSGDCESSFEAMAENLRGGLSLSLSGFGYWSHDIGGFEGTPRSDVYKRWCAFGLLSSHSRLHGSHSYRVPWNFDEEAVEVLKIFVSLKLALLPYLYTMAMHASTSGIPMMRPMILEFPEELSCEHLDRQYMLGNSLLVAPVLSEDGFASFYLPSGRWTEWFSGKIEEGGRWIKKQYDFMHLPLYARENSIIATSSGKKSASYNYLFDTIFKVFIISDGSNRCNVYNPEDRDEGYIQIENKKKSIYFEVTKNLFNWSVALYGVSGLSSQNDCTVFEEDGYWRVTPKVGVQKCEVKFESYKVV